jgi:hypothetical protein
MKPAANLYMKPKSGSRPRAPAMATVKPNDIVPGLTISQTVAIAPLKPAGVVRPYRALRRRETAAQTRRCGGLTNYGRQQVVEAHDIGAAVRAPSRQPVEAQYMPAWGSPFSQTPKEQVE